MSTVQAWLSCEVLVGDEGEADGRRLRPGRVREWYEEGWSYEEFDRLIKTVEVFLPVAERRLAAEQQAAPNDAGTQ